MATKEQTAVVALFDMDGTLFSGDSQLRFARWILRRYGWRRLYLALLIPCGILRALRILDTPRMKRAFLSYAWGMKKEDLLAECRDFVRQELLPESFPAVLEQLKAHQQAGDTTVLCSASPHWWVQFYGEALGFTHTIGTPVELGERVILFPSIPMPGNNKGANKLLRLAEIGITRADIGYTDSKADLPMLSICRRAVLIHPSDTLADAVPDARIMTPPGSVRKLTFTLRCLLGI